MDKVLFPMYKRRRLDSQGIDVWYVNDQEIREPFLLSTTLEAENQAALAIRLSLPDVLFKIQKVTPCLSDY